MTLSEYRAGGGFEMELKQVQQISDSIQTLEYGVRVKTPDENQALHYMGKWLQIVKQEVVKAMEKK